MGIQLEVPCDIVLRRIWDHNVGNRLGESMIVDRRSNELIRPHLV